MIKSGWGIATAAYLLLCLALGGASAAGALANGLLQLIAIALILALLWKRQRRPFPREGIGLVWIVGLFALFVLLSTVPLPAALWTGLPLRDQIANGYRLIGMAPPAIPLSLAPLESLSSLLWLLPPAALFLLILQLPADQRRALAFIVVAFAAVSVVLGAFQLMGGADSPLRFYSITNRTAPVGFFANANHEVTLLLCALPFVGFIAARAATGGSSFNRNAGLIVGVALALFLSVGIAISGSTAGYALFPIAAVASIILYRRAVAGRLEPVWLGGVALLVAAFAAIALQGPLSTEAFTEELREQPSSRKVLAQTTGQAIAHSFPAGTGLGSFQAIYRRYEDRHRVDRQFANHAHNDYIEATLELGIVGVLLIAGFMLWWGRRSIAAWRGDFQGAGLARAGSTVIAVVLLHSVADYPLRTSAVAALVGVACALLLPYRSIRVEAEAAAESAKSGETLRHIEAD